MPAAYGEPCPYPGSGNEGYGADSSPHDVHPSGAAAYGDTVQWGSAHDGRGVDEHVSEALSNLHTSAVVPVAVGGAWPAHPQGEVHSIGCGVLQSPRYIFSGPKHALFPNLFVVCFSPWLPQSCRRSLRPC